MKKSDFLSFFFFPEQKALEGRNLGSVHSPDTDLFEILITIFSTVKEGRTLSFWYPLSSGCRGSTYSNKLDVVAV